MKTIHFEQNDIIDIKYDNVFKAVFTREGDASRKALSKLVSALIGREVEIVMLCVNEPPINNLKDRQIRFDINCITENNERVNVEMSLYPKTYEPVRLEFYSGVLFTRQNISGTEKNYSDLKRSYQIAILANERLFKDEEFYHSFEYYDPIRNVSLNGRTRIITMELCKTEKIADKPTEEMSNSELWAYYFEYLTDKEKRGKILEILEKEEGIAMANEVLMSIGKDEIEGLRLMSELKNRLDYQSERSYDIRKGREEGMALGRQEGREEGIQEDRKYVLDLIAKGLSAEQIRQQLERG